MELLQGDLFDDLFRTFHRAFSRNSASSRAVPVKRMIEYVQRSPYVPRAFSVNKPGMNAHEFIEAGSPRWADVLARWMQSVETALCQARAGLELGVHKRFTDDDFTDGGSDRLVDALAAQGDPATVAARLREHLDAGADHVAIQLVTEPGADPILGYRRLADALF